MFNFLVVKADCRPASFVGVFTRLASDSKPIKGIYRECGRPLLPPFNPILFEACRPVWLSFPYELFALHEKRSLISERITLVG